MCALFQPLSTYWFAFHLLLPLPNDGIGRMQTQVDFASVCSANRKRRRSWSMHDVLPSSALAIIHAHPTLRQYLRHRPNARVPPRAQEVSFVFACSHHNVSSWLQQCVRPPLSSADDPRPPSRCMLHLPSIMHSHRRASSIHRGSFLVRFQHLRCWCASTSIPTQVFRVRLTSNGFNPHRSNRNNRPHLELSKSEACHRHRKQMQTHRSNCISPCTWGTISYDAIQWSEALNERSERRMTKGFPTKQGWDLPRLVSIAVHN
mmetsp:Transcript_3254/g.20237  ORF Transcript_3254/g.20237 Transcript_3254/m.20237 type:complete len:261 (+) Transcript_3254:4265-5047(+)